MKRIALLLLGVAGCNELDDYKRRSKKPEAEVNLGKLAKRLQVLAVEHGKFPVLTLGPTPDKSCCQYVGYKCPADAALWSAWQPLDFTVTEPFHFQYMYSSTGGTTFTATAIGDLDCDDTKVVYKLTGVLENGRAKTTVERPTNTD